MIPKCQRWIVRGGTHSLLVKIYNARYTDRFHSRVQRCRSNAAYASSLRVSSLILSASTLVLLMPFPTDVGVFIWTSPVASSPSSPWPVPESILGRLLDFLLGDPGTLASDDERLDVPIVPFPSGGSFLSRDMISLPPASRDGDTCIAIFRGGGLLDKKSSQDTSFGSPKITIRTCPQTSQDRGWTYFVRVSRLVWARVRANPSARMLARHAASGLHPKIQYKYHLDVAIAAAAAAMVVAAADTSLMGNHAAADGDGTVVP